MCRIYGILTNKRTEFQIREYLSTFSKLMAPGGPDGEGMFLSNEDNFFIAIGHRRLSIIDLSDRGSQPMKDINNQIIITFNGEIYNYKELKNQLLNLGYKFKSETDTEVILNSYLAWGIHCFDKLEGIFGFGLYDKRTNQFFLVRDKEGVKPVYYYHQDGELIFSSEMSPLNQLGLFNENQNWKSLFLIFGHLPEPCTTLSSVFCLPKGHFIQFDTKRFHFKMSTFVNEEAKKIISDLKEANKQIYESLRNAVLNQLVSDVPVAVFLSGGIDSSILTLLASQNNLKNVSTVSLDFSDSKLSESKYQEIITKKSGLKNLKFSVTSDFFETHFAEITKAYDQPSVDGINTWIISKFTRTTGAKVALSGVGADELFGGYPSFQKIKLTKFLDILPKPWFKSMQYHPLEKYKKIHYKELNDYLSNYLLFRANFSATTVAQLTETTQEEVKKILFDFLIKDKIDTYHDFGKVQWMESNFYMKNQLLKDTDYMSMRHGLEIRIPFLDPKVVCVAHSIDKKLWESENLPKELLIKSFIEILPEAIWKRPKMGFTLPFNEWMKKEMVVDGLLTSTNKKIRSLTQLFLENKLDWPRLWSLYLLENFSNLKK